MSFSSVLTNLVVPLNLCIALLIVSVLLHMVRWRKLATFVALLGVAWALFWSLPASSLWAGGRLEQYYGYSPPEALPPAEAIVVLGGNTAGGRENWFLPYDPQTAETRTEAAAKLFHARRAPLIVVSGAALDGSVSEAQTMARALVRAGVPESAIILETNSHNTRENAVFSSELLKEKGVSRVLLVTSALHMPRAMAVFTKQGVHPIAAPAPPQIVVPQNPDFSFWLPDLRSFEASRSIIKEYVGMLVYWIRGWI